MKKLLLLVVLAVFLTLSLNVNGLENLNEEELEVHISQILGLIAATPEYQFG